MIQMYHSRLARCKTICPTTNRRSDSHLQFLSLMESSAAFAHLNPNRCSTPPAQLVFTKKLTASVRAFLMSPKSTGASTDICMRCSDSLRPGCFMPRARRGRNGAGVGNAWVHHWLAVEVGGTLESSARKAWHEKVKGNQTRPACCSETRKGWDEKVTSSVIRAD
jgi:hypothetical protein